jgi:hypothetical protein
MIFQLKWRICAPLLGLTWPGPFPRRVNGCRQKNFKDISGLTHASGVSTANRGLQADPELKDASLKGAGGYPGCSGDHSPPGFRNFREDISGKISIQLCRRCHQRGQCRAGFFRLYTGAAKQPFEGGLPIGASLEDLGKGMRSQIGTCSAPRPREPLS